MLDKVFKLDVEKLYQQHPILDWSKQNEIIKNLILNILIQKKLSIPASNTDLNNFLLLVINGRNDTVEKAELATQERERFDDFSPIRLDKSTLSLKSPAEISDIKLSGEFLESSEDNIDAIYKKLFQISEDIQSIKRNPFYDVREKIDELTFELKKCKKIFDKSTSDFSSISLDSIDKQLRTRLTSSVLLENSFSLKSTSSKDDITEMPQSQIFYSRKIEPKRVLDAKKIHCGKYYRSKTLFNQICFSLKRICEERGYEKFTLQDSISHGSTFETGANPDSIVSIKKGSLKLSNRNLV
jgi:hypothetical protein